MLTIRLVTMTRGALCALLMLGATQVVQAQVGCPVGAVCDPAPDPALHPREVPTNVGEDQVVVDVPSFLSVATYVTQSGNTDADFCVAPDPREVKVNATTYRYEARPLQLKELAGKGSCTGDIPPDSAGRDTWEELLASGTGAGDLRVDPGYRTFKSKYQNAAGDWETGYWLVVGVVRSSAQFKGPVVSAPFPEQLLDYGAFNEVNDYGQPKCGGPLGNRPLTLSGMVPAFDEPSNVEGNRMILDTILCDGGIGATRKSVHLYYVYRQTSLLSEAVSIANVLNGLNLTINQAGSCVNSASKPAIAEMRRRLLNAAASIAAAYLSRNSATKNAKWDSAIADLDQIARLAHYNISGCSDYFNYEGALMARAENAAFIVWDWLKHPSPTTWQIRTIPEELDLPVLPPGRETEGETE